MKDSSIKREVDAEETLIDADMETKKPESL